MKLPRWTTYPAIAIILLLVVMAIPQSKRGRGAALSKRQAIDTSATSGAAQLLPSEGSVAPGVGLNLRVIDFLPAGFVTDGSVDYRAALQLAIDASAGKRLELPSFPLRVGRTPGQKYGVRLSSGLQLVGSPSSVLQTTQKGLQLLRGQGVENVSLEGFTLRGPGGTGQAMAHGLLQVTGGTNIRVTGLTILGADADGIAFAQLQGCSVERCAVLGASKSGIYLSNCTGGIVANNRVESFGGHILPDGKPVGVGIQLSSNSGVLCEGNIIREGTGVGILCNALGGGAKPDGNLLSGNLVSDVRNPTYLGVSGGIRLANGNADKQTETVVSGNRVTRCGANGIYVENHGGTTVIGNLVSYSDRAGILISMIDGVYVSENLVRASGQAPSGPLAAIQLVNDVRGATVRNNWTGAGKGYAPTLDHSTGNGDGNSLEARLRDGDSSPFDGSWNVGDRVYNNRPQSGEPIGWVCTAAGTPGVWSAFGRIE